MAVRRRRACVCVVVKAVVAAAVMTALPPTASAQQSASSRADSARAASVRTDSVRTDSAVLSPPDVRLLRPGADPLPVPPLSPARAFLYSFAIPGLAQTKFDRGSAGALFAAVELGALAMLKRSNDEVRAAKYFLDDSLPGDFQVGADGKLRPTGISTGGFDRVLVRRRRLHMEDWLAVILFNHLLSGADAFVAAQLFDLPAAIALYPGAGGGVLVATVKW